MERLTYRDKDGFPMMKKRGGFKQGGVERLAAYYATEIDKYAVQTTQHNFPDTVQLGDAFQVRERDWGWRL